MLLGGILYYTDDNKRIKLLSYEQPSKKNTITENKTSDETTTKSEIRNIDRIYPIYSELLGISPSWIARNMRKAIDAIPDYFKEYLPEEFLKKF